VPAVVGPALVAAALLALAGAQKLLDPVMTVGALRVLGLPVSNSAVRAGAAAELTLGACAVAVGGELLWLGVAASYAGFAAFVLVALRRGTMIGSCGCFGREDTPPHPTHVALNLALAATSLIAAATLSGSIVDELTDHGASGLVVTALAAVSLFALYAAYVELPRALVAGRRSRTDRQPPINSAS
jgi:hypothetical protein